MSLLSLERVTKRYPRGGRERIALRDVSVAIEPGELVAVWGRRRSGRTTLLRVAAGLERPDEGIVRFDRRPLAGDPGWLLGSQIGIVRTGFNAANAARVVEHVALALLALDARMDRACAQADALLERVGASGCADLEPRELDAAETARVAIARALIAQPRLLLVDEPTKGVDLLARDSILQLLRSIAGDEIAVLMTAGEATELSGADRALAISDGELRGHAVPRDAPVVPLRLHRAEPSG